MFYEKMLPYQFREAIAENRPLAIPIGVLEDHSEHLGSATDAHVVRKILERVEHDYPELILFPTFYFGCASFAVADPEVFQGTLDFDARTVSAMAEELFHNLLLAGFRNIHGFVFHQSENFQQGMPTDLAFRLAARRAIFSFLEQKHGRGWWGEKEMSGYYTGSNPFAWIQIHAIQDKETEENCPVDHAGMVETSLMKALCPDEADMNHYTAEHWYSRNAVESTAEFGEKIALQYTRNAIRILDLSKKRGCHEN